MLDLTQFKQISSNIKLSNQLISRPDFILTRSIPSLTSEEKEQLINFATWKTIFPASLRESFGRSIYAETSEDSIWKKQGVDAIKAKGIGGLDFFIDAKLKLVPPNPNTAFDQVSQLHIAITPTLDIIVVESRRKAFFSLSDTGAINEFDNHLELYKAQIGFKPLVAGKFINSDGKPELDFTGKNGTGGVFLSFNPEFSKLSNFQDFLIVDQNKYIPPSAQNLSNEKITPLKLVENYIKFAIKIARAKAHAAIEANVFRHSSYGSNLFFNSSGGTEGITYMTDTDSCLKLEDLPSGGKGVQLLRDFSTSTVRMIEDLSLSAHSKWFYTELEKKSFKPFHQFIEGLFGNTILPSQIEESGNALHHHYLQFILVHHKHLPRIATSYREGIMNKNRKEQSGASFTWHMVHQFFLQPIICEYYKLITSSKLNNTFKLPLIDPYTLRKKVSTGIDNFVTKLVEQNM